MNLLNIIRLVLKTTRANFTRTLLTILGVSVGIAAIYGLVGIGFGLQWLTASTIATAEALTTIDILSPSDALPLTSDLASKTKNVPHVANVAKLFTVPSQLMLEGKISDTQLNLVDVAFLSYSGLDVEFGKSLENDSEKAVVVSSALEKLFGIEDPQGLLGKEIQISPFVEKEDGTEMILKKEEKFSVVGIFLDDQVSQVYLAFSHVPEIKPHAYHAFKVKVDSKEHIETVRATIADQGYTVTSVSDFIKQIDKVFKVVQTILAIFGFIALFVSAIGMFNTMTIALLERTHDIGIMKAVGIENRDIWKLFVTESTFIGVFGGLLGVLIGMMGGELLNVGVNLLAKSFGGETLDIFYTPFWFLVTILVVSTFIGIITGFYPARRASHLNPLDALRYE